MTSFFPAMTTMAVILSLFLQQSSLMAAAAELEEMVHMAGYGEEKLSTVLITGSVLCQACHLHHHHHPQLRSWPISGAMVIVKCETPCKTISYTTQATTDEYGDYIIDLPSHLHGITNLKNICSVKVIRIPRKLKCRPAPVKKHKPLKLSSVQDDIRTYTVGKTRFQHMASKPLKSCIRKATNTAKQIA